MLNSFEQATQYAVANGVYSDFNPRFIAIYEEAKRLKWKNKGQFEAILERL